MERRVGAGHALDGHVDASRLELRVYGEELCQHLRVLGVLLECREHAQHINALQLVNVLDELRRLCVPNAYPIEARVHLDEDLCTDTQPIGRRAQLLGVVPRVDGLGDAVLDHRVILLLGEQHIHVQDIELQTRLSDLEGLVELGHHAPLHAP